MSYRLKYSADQAAEFLRITVRQLVTLTKQGHIRKQRYKKQEFYLGGELDCVKRDVKNLVSQLPSEPPILPYCDPSRLNVRILAIPA